MTAPAGGSKNLFFHENSMTDSLVFLKGEEKISYISENN